jgi:hypothetical protein
MKPMDNLAKGGQGGLHAHRLEYTQMDMLISSFALLKLHCGLIQEQLRDRDNRIHLLEERLEEQAQHLHTNQMKANEAGPAAFYFAEINIFVF